MESTCLQRKQIVMEYLESLAKGRDPVSGARISDDSVLNNRQIISVLEDAVKIIKSSGDVKGVLLAKMVSEQLNPIHLNQPVITISELCGLINEGMARVAKCRIRPQLMTSWLEEKGYLKTKVIPDGYRYRVPTDTGKKLGITSEERKSKSNIKYFVNYYNQFACNYILENLSSIMSDERAS